MDGDTVTIATQAWYTGAVQPPPSGASNLLNDLLSALTGGVISNSHSLYSTSDNNPTTVLSGDLPAFFTNDENTNYTTAAPKAFLNWVAFDNQLNEVSANSGVVQVPTITGSEPAQPLVSPEQIIQKDGYLYIYVSNESAQKVFFDNLVIHHNKGHLLEEDQYYPYGLKMAGISDEALPAVPNNYLYNGKELQQNEFSDGSSVGWYDYGFRNYDPQLGRFTEQDPLTNELASVSPYQYALNDPVANIDEDGLSPFNLLCPGTSGFSIFLMKLGDAVTQIAHSPITRVVSMAATSLRVAGIVSNTLTVSNEINNSFMAEGVGGVANTGTGTEGASSENIGENDGGPGRPFLLPIVPFKFIELEGKWTVKVINEFINPIIQNAKTLFKGTNPNGSKATTFQRVNAGINFVAQTATLGGKGESDPEIGEMGEEPRVKDGNEAGELNNSKWYDENGNIIWPKNNGFESTPEKTTLPEGTQFDRYGYSSGSFASPRGTSFSERSLPLSSYLKPLTSYEVIKPVDVLSGKVAPWFGEPGGGIQYKFSTTIQQLIKEGYIKEIK